MTPFRAFRRKRINYGNDDLPLFLSFAATPRRLGAIVRAIAEVPFAREAMNRTVAQHVSVSILDTSGPKRPGYVELLLDSDEARIVLKHLRAALDSRDLTALETIAAYEKML